MQSKEISSERKGKTPRMIMMIIFFEFILFLLYFNYSFFSVGPYDKLARIVILVLMVLYPFLFIYATRTDHKLIDKLFIVVNWFFFVSGILLLIIKPYVVSIGLYDLYAVETILVLNPAFTLSYLAFLFVFFIAIPRFKSYDFKTFLILFLPVLLWIAIRFIYLYHS